MESFWFFAGIIVIVPELECRRTAQAQEVSLQVKKLAPVT